MASYWEQVNRVLREADLLIEVLDARMVEETRHQEIEQKLRRLGKKVLYVLTKADLVPGEELRSVAAKLQPSVFVSSTKKWGTTILKKKILELSRGQQVVVGVVGYPNVGKSSLINALAGRSSARTSPESGFTKGLQKIRVGTKILLIDTPGVFPGRERDEFKRIKIGAVDQSKVRDAETAALRLIEQHPELVKMYYQVEREDPEEILEQIGLKLKKLSKGGKVNLDVTARLVLKDWQRGKIRK